MSKYWGHTSPERSWEPLEEHLEKVASLAGQFAQGFNATDWGEIAGLWHDLGKYSAAFQSYLSDSSKQDETGIPGERVDHATAGAQWAIERGKTLGLLLAYPIAGHHSGLLDYISNMGQASMKARLEKSIHPWNENAASAVLDIPFPAIPNIAQISKDESEWKRRMSFRLAFWIRMLFSCLTDADYLATEAYMSPHNSVHRPEGMDHVPAMIGALEAKLDLLTEQATDTVVNNHRCEVLTHCRKAATEPVGFFDLCVPTGGGKTLSSLAFALEHANVHGLRRVIMAIPFTSIIEQNATVYRDVFAELGDGIVLEHHSNTDPNEETYTNRLQVQNWDAPLVVTTNVQLFESLFASRSGRCRKLHRIAGSVIVLDEVQTIPVELLKPTLWCLRELVETYGCTVVLCTATQPALSKQEDFPDGLPDVRSIIPDAKALYNAMRRVSVERIGAIPQSDLAKRLLAEAQALCILNTKNDAAEVYRLLGEEEGHYHLSTRMCAAHRLETIRSIRQHLTNAESCRVVSTQLVEAGVDLDFPAVYRAPCGVDSLAQAAGRCNREGKRDIGRVIHFKTESPPPAGFLRQTAQTGSEVMSLHDDPLSLEAIEHYFRLLYWQQGEEIDKKNVLGSFPPDSKFQFQFAEAAEKYRFIENREHTVFVPWKKDGRALIGDLCRSDMPTSGLLRKLQRYGVGVNDKELDLLKKEGAIREANERWVLDDNMAFYNEKLGLVFENSRTAEDLVI